MEYANLSEIEAVDHRTEIVIFHDLAEVVVDNSKALVWVGTQTFTIRHLDDEESMEFHSGDCPQVQIDGTAVPHENSLLNKTDSICTSKTKKKHTNVRTASSLFRMDRLDSLENGISNNSINRINNNVECIDLGENDDVEEITNVSDNTSSSDESVQFIEIEKRRPGRQKMHKRRRPSNCDTWCHLCGIDYGSEDKRFRHQLTHFGINPERCPRCRKYFSQNSTYYAHMCSHNSNLKPQSELPIANRSNKLMECSSCRKTFPGMYKLKRHEISHTGEKPYKCRVCCRAFTQCTVMSRHNCPGKMISPDKINPSCDICGRIFRNDKYLKIHRSIHAFEGRSDVDERDIEEAFKNNNLEIEVPDAAEFLRDMFG